MCWVATVLWWFPRNVTRCFVANVITLSEPTILRLYDMRSTLAHGLPWPTISLKTIIMMFRLMEVLAHHSVFLYRHTRTSWKVGNANTLLVLRYSCRSPKIGSVLAPRNRTSRKLDQILVISCCVEMNRTEITRGVRPRIPPLYSTLL